MVEGTLKGAEKKREKEVAARAAGIGVLPSLQCHCLKLEPMVKR
jgi:hypothetical protein